MNVLNIFDNAAMVGTLLGAIIGGIGSIAGGIWGVKKNYDLIKKIGWKIRKPKRLVIKPWCVRILIEQIDFWKKHIQRTINHLFVTAYHIQVNI